MTELNQQQGPAVESIEQLGEELAPVATELGKSAAQIIAQLEAFTKTLEQQGNQEQQAGESFLETLAKTIEQLNQAFEQGAAEAAEQAPVQQ